MSDRIYHDVDDVFFEGSVTNVHHDGQDRVSRFRQADGKRFVCYEESGWVYFTARRTIMVPRSHIAHMEPLSVARAKELGPNPYAPSKPERNGK